MALEHPIYTGNDAMAETGYDMAKEAGVEIDKAYRERYGLRRDRQNIDSAN